MSAKKFRLKFDTEKGYYPQYIDSMLKAYAEEKVKEAVQAIKTNLKLTPYFYEQAEAHGILEGDTIDWNTIDEAVKTIKFD